MSEKIIITCPHCELLIMILELNCQIFRHGVFISNDEQIDPHTSKTVCDDLVEKKLIYGCGKPFRIDKNGDEYIASICEYI
jgi:hypothetical protein